MVSKNHSFAVSFILRKKLGSPDTISPMNVFIIQYLSFLLDLKGILTKFFPTPYHCLSKRELLAGLA
jgi:hypothetical protein